MRNLILDIRSHEEIRLRLTRARQNVCKLSVARLQSQVPQRFVASNSRILAKYCVHRAMRTAPKRSVPQSLQQSSLMFSIENAFNQVRWSVIKNPCKSLAWGVIVWRYAGDEPVVVFCARHNNPPQTESWPGVGRDHRCRWMHFSEDIEQNLMGSARLTEANP